MAWLWSLGKGQYKKNEHNQCSSVFKEGTLEKHTNAFKFDSNTFFKLLKTYCTYEDTHQKSFIT